MSKKAVSDKLSLSDQVKQLRAQLEDLEWDHQQLALLQQQPKKLAHAFLDRLCLGPDQVASKPAKSTEPLYCLVALLVLVLLLVFAPVAVPQLESLHFLLFGTVMIGCAWWLAYSRELNRQQYCVVAGTLAIGTALVATVLPGYLDIDLPVRAQAGGALGVFAMVFYLMLKYGVPQPT